MKQNGKSAVVLLSGGLDSATCLAIAHAQGYACHALSLNYQQRHISELNAAKALAQKYQVLSHQVMSVNLDAIGGSALTDNSIDVPAYSNESIIPVTYVPARNTLLLTLALGWAEVLEAQDIFIGVNAVDYSGYPDCRPEFIKSFQQTANLGTKAGVEGKPFKFHTPLISLSKSEIIKQGIALGLDYSLTISCYQADDEGRACGHCDSCAIRKEGFESAGIDDPTRYQ